MKYKQIKEKFADEAGKAEKDHEVQMARGDLYKAAKYSIKLHDMMKNIGETEGLEGWIQEKITKASDYLNTVFNHFDYKSKFNNSVNFVGETNPLPDMNKYGIYTTKSKDGDFQVWQNEKHLGTFKTIEDVDAFLHDYLNKEESTNEKDSYKEDLSTKLQNKLSK